MSRLLADIEVALRQEDIEGLIALGAPLDEYSSEAKEIAGALALLTAEQYTVEQIVAVIALVWARFFNRGPEEIEMRMPAFQKVAQQILAN